jgi:hypothetical protein
VAKFQVKGDVGGSVTLHFVAPSSIVPVPAVVKVNILSFWHVCKEEE